MKDLSEQIKEILQGYVVSDQITCFNSIVFIISDEITTRDLREIDEANEIN